MPSRAALDCWKAENVKRVIVGTQQRDITRQQLAACVAAGFEVEAYVYLYFDEGVREQIRSAKNTVLGFPVNRMWLDLEDKQVAPSNVFMDDMRDEADKHGEWGIYTARWWWDFVMGPFELFSDKPLWYASYDSIPDFSDFEPFGGWQGAAGKQYQGDVSLGGVQVDLNVFRI